MVKLQLAWWISAIVNTWTVSVQVIASHAAWRPSLVPITRPRSTQITLITLNKRSIPVDSGTLYIAFTRCQAGCDGRCSVSCTIKNLCVGKHSPTFAAWAHTCKVCINKRPQKGKLYAMTTFFCLSVRSFVRLSPTRTGRALVWLPTIPTVLSAVIGRSAHGGCEGLSSRPLGPHWLV